MQAQGFALAGIPDRALDRLAVAVERGFIDYPYLARYDRSLDSIRSHPRFEPLMETVRVRWERFDE